MHRILQNQQPFELEALLEQSANILKSKYAQTHLETFLHGSYSVPGSAKGTSDFDLIVVLKSAKDSPRKRRLDLTEFDDWKGPEVNAVIYSVDEFRQYPPLTWSLLRSHLPVIGGKPYEELISGLVAYAASIKLQWQGDKQFGYWNWHA